MPRLTSYRWFGTATLIAGIASSAAWPQQGTTVATSQSNSVTTIEEHPRYLVHPQDVILISFPLSPELNQTVTIQPDGFISLQNVGSIFVQGLSLPDVVVAVKKAYSAVLHAPIVDVDLQDSQKPLFTVSGQVGKPGQYELRSDVTVTQALAVAGGMTMMTARTQVFLFHRTSQAWAEVKEIDLKSVLKGKKLEEDVLLQPGDMVYVPEKFIANFKKYVPYVVNLGTYLQAPVL